MFSSHFSDLSIYCVRCTDERFCMTNNCVLCVLQDCVTFHRAIETTSTAPLVKQCKTGKNTCRKKRKKQYKPWAQISRVSQNRANKNQKIHEKWGTDPLCILFFPRYLVFHLHFTDISFHLHHHFHTLFFALSLFCNTIYRTEIQPTVFCESATQFRVSIVRSLSLEEQSKSKCM